MSEGKKRKVHSAEFKAKVGMEAVRGMKTINEIGQQYGVHPVLVGQWKKVANLDALFDRGLISFDIAGGLISPRPRAEQCVQLRLDELLALRWVTVEHQAYLAWHRSQVFQAGKPYLLAHDIAADSP